MIAVTTSISTTAVKIVSSAVNETRKVTLRADTADLYIGGSTVTTASGLLLEHKTVLTIEVPPNEELWAIVSSGTHSITTLTSFAETV